MRVLVTGAAGFIGSHLCERLASRGDTVVGFDNFDAFYGRPIKERNLREVLTGVDASATPGGSFVFIEGDIRTSEAVSAAFRTAAPDVVVHLAALAGVRP